MVDMDLSPGDSFNKKIRNAQLAQYNYILGMYISVCIMSCDMHVMVCVCVCDM